MRMHTLHVFIPVKSTGLRPEEAFAAGTLRQVVGAGLPPGLCQGSVQRQGGARLKLHADPGPVRETLLATPLR